MNITVESTKVTTISCLPGELRDLADAMEERVERWSLDDEDSLLVDTWSGFGGSVKFVVNDTRLRELLTEK